MIKLLFFCTLVFSLRGYSGGTLQLSGQVRNFDANQIDIQENGKIYSVSRKKITGAQAAQLAQLRSGVELKLTVPFDAIVNVKTLK